MHLARSLPASRRQAIELRAITLASCLLLTGAALDLPHPTTPAIPSLLLPIDIAAVGDMVCGPAIEPDPGECQDTSVLAEDADLVLTLGDTTYPVGANDEWPAFDAMWGDLPIVAVPGNHEYHQADARPFYDYMGGRTSDLGYFALDLPGWRVYGLNSNCSKIDCAAEIRWLAMQRQDEPACTLAMLHHPLRSSYRGESIEDVDELYAALATIDLILAGHSHNYERIDLGSSQLVIVGTGGRSVYPFNNDAPGSVARYDDAYGVLRLILEEGAYESAFTTFDGDRDVHGASC